MCVTGERDIAMYVLLLQVVCASLTRKRPKKKYSPHGLDGTMFKNNSLPSSYEAGDTVQFMKSSEYETIPSKNGMEAESVIYGNLIGK